MATAEESSSNTASSDIMQIDPQLLNSVFDRGLELLQLQWNSYEHPHARKSKNRQPKRHRCSQEEFSWQLGCPPIEAPLADVLNKKPTKHRLDDMLRSNRDDRTRGFGADHDAFRSFGGTLPNEDMDGTAPAPKVFRVRCPGDSFSREVSLSCSQLSHKMLVTKIAAKFKKEASQVVEVCKVPDVEVFDDDDVARLENRQHLEVQFAINLEV